MSKKVSVPNRTRNRNTDEFEITNRTVKTLEKRLNGIEPSPKTLAKNILGGSVGRIKYRNPNQKLFLDIIDENEIVICSGPAGCGKSYLAIVKAFQLLLDPNNNYNEIVISTPAVEADEKLGFLPGSIEEKLSPYTFSTYYLMEKVIGKYALDELINKKIINILGFGFMRGINIDNSIVLIEEAQNTTIRQMKTLLTRIGEDSKFIISGDIKQSDRFNSNKIKDSGLYFAIEHLNNLEGIGIFEFDETDIVRNAIIGKIIKIFEDNGK